MKKNIRMLDMDLICWWVMEFKRKKIGEGTSGYEGGGMISNLRNMVGIDIGKWATDTFRKGPHSIKPLM